MKAKPFYRSLIFWSGLLVAAFIAFAWVDSRDVSTTGSFSRKGWGFGMVHSLECVDFMWTTGSAVEPSADVSRLPPGFTLLPPRWEGRSAMPAYEVDSFDAAWGGASALTTRHLILPHWLLLGLWCLLWGSLLLWRGIRIRRRDGMTNDEFPNVE